MRVHAAPRILRALALCLPLAAVLGLSTATRVPTITFAAAANSTSTSSTCAQPTPGINVNTMSDAQLMSYGLPSHAMLAQDPSAWARALPHMLHRSCGSKPSNYHTSIKQPQHYAYGINQCSPIYSGEVCRNTSWAGNEAFASRGTYRPSSVDFYVPSIPTGVYLVNSMVLNWTGVGGDTAATGGPSYGLIQAGVRTDVLTNGQKEDNFTCQQNYCVHNAAWWEALVFGQSPLPMEDFSLSIGTGDHIYVYVSSNLNNDGYNYFQVSNWSWDTYSSCYLSTTGGSVPGPSCGVYYPYASDSASAECIVERESGDPLAQFNYNQSPTNTLNLNHCDVNGSYINSVTHDYDLLVNSSGSQLATCGAIDGVGDFPVYWHAGS